MDNKKRIAQYWIGKDLNPNEFWDVYHTDPGYAKKFWQIKTHFLQIELKENDQFGPLNSFEAVYKTVKSYFHEIKFKCFPDEYNSLAPLYFYAIHRNPTKLLFLGELPPLLIFALSLATKKYLGEDLGPSQTILNFVHDNFSIMQLDANLSYFQNTQDGLLKDAFDNMVELGVNSVQISTEAYTPQLLAYNLIEVPELFSEELQVWANQVSEPPASYSGIMWEDHITRDPRVLGGQPCIKGTRVPISVVLDNLATGLTADQIIEDYPSLRRADVLAVLAYAADLARVASKLTI